MNCWEKNFLRWCLLNKKKKHQKNQLSFSLEWGKMGKYIGVDLKCTASTCLSAPNSSLPPKPEKRTEKLRWKRKKNPVQWRGKMIRTFRFCNSHLWQKCTFCYSAYTFSILLSFGTKDSVSVEAWGREKAGIYRHVQESSFWPLQSAGDVPSNPPPPLSNCPRHRALEI